MGQSAITLRSTLHTEIPHLIFVDCAELRQGG